MGTFCRTIPGDRWTATLTQSGTEIGIFTTDPENNEGYFTGVFVSSGIQEQIMGKCDATTVYFLLPFDRPRYYYVASFVGNDRLHGKRVRLPVFPLDALADESFADEEWEGEKVPTLRESSY